MDSVLYVITHLCNQVVSSYCKGIKNCKKTNLLIFYVIFPQVRNDTIAMFKTTPTVLPDDFMKTRQIS